MSTKKGTTKTARLPKLSLPWDEVVLENISITDPVTGQFKSDICQIEYNHSDGKKYQLQVLTEIFRFGGPRENQGDDGNTFWSCIGKLEIVTNPKHAAMLEFFRALRERFIDLINVPGKRDKLIKGLTAGKRTDDDWRREIESRFPLKRFVTLETRKDEDGNQVEDLTKPATLFMTPLDVEYEKKGKDGKVTTAFYQATVRKLRVKDGMEVSTPVKYNTFKEEQKSYDGIVVFSLERITGYGGVTCKWTAMDFCLLAEYVFKRESVATKRAIELARKNPSILQEQVDEDDDGDDARDEALSKETAELKIGTGGKKRLPISDETPPP